MSRFKSLPILVVLLVLVADVIFVNAEVPQVINYQGRLTDGDGTPVADDTYLIKFIIYDGSGVEQWNSQFQTVDVTRGLFNVELGAPPMTSLPDDLFEDTLRYLGITVGTDDEISPRSRLVTTPYAYHALRADTAEVISGDLYLKAANDTLMGHLYFGGTGGRFNVEYNFANLLLTDNGVSTTQLYGEHYGTLSLRDPDGIETALLDATDFMGGKLILTDASNNPTIELYGGESNDKAVIFPYNAVNSSEILNETGVASTSVNSTIALNPYSMTDIAEIYITIPEDGYILVFGQCYAGTFGNTNYDYLYIQIDETSGGNYTLPYCVRAGMATYPSVNMHSYPIMVKRIYWKAAGTYSFRLEGMNANNDHTANAYAENITALYIPTGYGAIKSFVSSPDGFEDFKAVDMITGDDGNETKTMYEVDLRELELKAARTRAAALEAELELLEAKRK